MHKSCFIWYFLEYLKLLFNQLIQRRLWINPDGVNGARNSAWPIFISWLKKLTDVRQRRLNPGLYGQTFFHLSTSVHLFKFLMFRRLNPSMRCTVCHRPPSTSVHLGQKIIVCRIRPWVLRWRKPSYILANK